MLFLFIIFLAHSSYSISWVAVIALHGQYKVGRWKGCISLVSQRMGWLVQFGLKISISAPLLVILSILSLHNNWWFQGFQRIVFKFFITQIIACIVQHIQLWRNFFINDFLFLCLLLDFCWCLTYCHSFTILLAALTVIALTVVKKELNVFFSFSWGWLCLVLLLFAFFLLSLPWIPQLCVVFVWNAKSTSMQLLFYNSPPCINLCLLFHLLLVMHSISVGFHYMCDLFFLCFVGRLDSAFRHGESVFLGIINYRDPEVPVAYVTKFCNQHCSSVVW